MNYAKINIDLHGEKISSLKQKIVCKFLRLCDQGFIISHQQLTMG
jgi:hypothetical protein